MFHICQIKNFSIMRFEIIPKSSNLVCKETIWQRWQTLNLCQKCPPMVTWRHLTYKQQDEGGNGKSMSANDLVRPTGRTQLSFLQPLLWKAANIPKFRRKILKCVLLLWIVGSGNWFYFQSNCDYFALNGGWFVRSRWQL